MRGYHCAAVTLNLFRAFTTGGYADLRQVHAWNQDFVRGQPVRATLRAARQRDRPGPSFMRGLRHRPDELRTVEFYSSHEALLLDYEQALTRIDSRTGRPTTSAHFVWIGERTRASTARTSTSRPASATPSA